MTSVDDGVTAVIQLGRVEAFRLGRLLVQPATRQVVCGERRETLEPRVMQVLVALALAGGDVVTRDRLIASCWAGVVVGDNSIHQAISRLRELAQAFGAPAFRIETIARVGYRLEVLDTVQPVSPIPPAPQPLAPTRHRPRWSPWIAAVSGGVALVTAGLAAAVLTSGSSRPALSVDVEGEGGPAAMRLAQLVTAETPRMVDGAALDVSLVETSHNSGRPAWRAYVTVSEEKGISRSDLRVIASRNAELLWSESFERASGDAQGLSMALASRLTAVLDCAHQAVGGGTPSDFATVRLFVAACVQIPGSTNLSTLGLLRSVTARAPDSAAGWAWRGLAEAQIAGDLHDGSQASEHQRQALRADARNHLDRADSLGARRGLTALGRVTLIPPGDWKDRLAVIDKGLSADPEFGPLYIQAAQDLQKIGRLVDAVDRARRGMALKPLDAYSSSTLIYTLEQSGRTQPARDALVAAERTWPDSQLIQDARINFDLRFGDPLEAIRLIDEGKFNDWGTSEFFHGAVRSFLLARANPTPTNIDAAIKAANPSGTPGRAWEIQARAYFGQIDDAFEELKTPASLARLDQYTELLFRPFTRSLRLDPRFMVLAARLGLTAYWRQSGQWPDFCGDRGLPYDCQAEAGRAERMLSSAR